MWLSASASPYMTALIVGRQPSRPAEFSSPSAWQEVKTQLKKQCCERVTQLGVRFGRERVVVATVAFGDPKGNYSMLKEMAKDKGTLTNVAATVHEGTSNASVGEIKAELKSLNVEPAGLFEKSDFVDALFAARARASAKR